VAGLRVGLERLQDFPAVHRRHHHVERDGLGLQPAGQRENMAGLLDADDAHRTAAQVTLEHADGRLLVVHDEDGQLIGAREREG